MKIKEDDMTSTLTPTCSFCGLAFANRPMLELHIREDHLQRGHAAEPGQGDPAGARAERLHAGGPDPEHGKPATPPRAIKEVTTMNGTHPRHRLAGWAVTGVRRVIGAFRHANAELTLATEIMFRPAGAAPRPPADISADPDTHAASTEPEGKAA